MEDNVISVTNSYGETVIDMVLPPSVVENAFAISTNKIFNSGLGGSRNAYTTIFVPDGAYVCSATFGRGYGPGMNVFQGGSIEFFYYNAVKNRYKLIPRSIEIAMTMILIIMVNFLESIRHMKIHGNQLVSNCSKIKLI